MKRFLSTLIAVIVIHSFASAQLVGGFTIGNDGHIYFQARNNTSYNYQISIVAESSDNYNSENIGVGAGGGFYLGPTTPWRWYWKKGDKISVVYPNGQYQYWVCPQNDKVYKRNNITFKGKHCHGSVGCSCPGFEPIQNKEVYKQSYCKHCGHHKKYHNL